MSSPIAALRRPLGVGVVVLALVLGAFVGPATPSAGDEIDDTRSEAARIADQIEDLQHDAEVLTERFLDAQVQRQELEGQIADAQARADRSGAQLDAARDDLRAFTVQSYVDEGAATPADVVLGASDASDVTVRRGYAHAVALDGDDLVDQYRGAERRATRDSTRLDALLADAQAAEDAIDESRSATEERVAELQALQSQVTGRLRTLVEAEQRRREEEQARQAAEAQAAAQREAEAQAARAAQEAAAAEAAAAAQTPTTETPAVAPPAQDPAPPPTSTPTPVTEPAPEPPPPPPPPPTAASGADAAIAAARTVLGVPYKWAGASPSQGFDCSGLTMWAWSHGGRSLPHSSRAQYAMSRRIPVDQLQPGDLVFYNSPVSHVGLYIGGGMMIHAPHTGSVVQIQSIHYWSALVGGGRI